MRALPLWLLLIAACSGDKTDTTDTTDTTDADTDADTDSDTDTDTDTDSDTDTDTDTDADTDPSTCGGLSSPVNPSEWYDALISKYCDVWDAGCTYPVGHSTGSGWTATTPTECPALEYSGSLPPGCTLNEAAACACLDATFTCAGDSIEIAPSCESALRCGGTGTSTGGSGHWTSGSGDWTTWTGGSGDWTTGTTPWTGGSGDWTATTTDPGTGGSGRSTSTTTGTSTGP